MNLEFNSELFTPEEMGEIVLEETQEMGETELTEQPEVLNNANIIRNISFDQGEILWNIMQLYNNGEPFECDMTASELKFYGERKGSNYIIPEPKILFDVYPTQEKIKKITPFQKLPLEDGSIGSIVIDLPFVISPHNAPSAKNPKDGSCLIFKRFSSFYPVEELIETIYWFLKESYRVLKPNGICIWKMQPTVSGGRQVWSTYFSFLAAQKFGFYVRDEFILQAKARLVSPSKIKKQCHARKFTSTFYVFEKDQKKFEKNSIFKMLEMCEEQDKNGTLEGKIWEVK